MSIKKNRGTTLNRSKVRGWASYRGIHSLKQFRILYEDMMSTRNPDGKTLSAADNAWKGKNMDIYYAETIAELLSCSLPDLMLAEGQSQWANLTQEPAFLSPFLQKSIQDDTQEGFMESVYALKDQNDGFEQVPVTSSIRLILTGQKDDKIFILIESRKDARILAPLNVSQEGFINVFKESELIYPQGNPLRFSQGHDKELGWKKITVIKSPLLDILPAFDISRPVTTPEIEAISHKIQNAHIGQEKLLAIDSWEFVLV